MSNEYPYASMRDRFDLDRVLRGRPEDCKDRPLTEVIDQALHGGATFIQLRAKGADASELTEMAATSRRSSRTTRSPTQWPS